MTTPPAAALTIPGNPTESAALAWLHANCGLSCHSEQPSAMAHFTGLFMRLGATQLASVQDTDTYATAVGVASSFQPSPDGGFLLIKPGDAARSAIPYRASARDSATQVGVQMPPIGTSVPDADGVKLLTAWIDAM